MYDESKIIFTRKNSDGLKYTKSDFFRDVYTCRTGTWGGQNIIYIRAKFVVDFSSGSEFNISPRRLIKLQKLLPILGFS